MRKLYISLAFLAILLAFFIILLFVSIPSPSKIIKENYTLEIR